MKGLLMSIAIFGFVAIGKAQPALEKALSQIEPEVVVNDFFDAFRKKDHARLNSLLHPDVIWIQPGVNRISGVKKSREEVLLMGKQMNVLSEKTIELVDIKILSATGNSVACVLRWRAVQPTGVKLDVMNIDVYTVENGMIVTARIFSDDLVQEDKFWGR